MDTTAKGENPMGKKIKTVLWVGFITLILLCIAMFVTIGVVMTKKNKEAIKEIGTIYMTEVNIQIQQKFNAVAELQLSKLRGLIGDNPPEKMVYGEEMMEFLQVSAGVRDFEYLGAYEEDGTCEVWCGDPIEVSDEVTFNEVLKGSDSYVFSAVSEAGQRLLCVMKEVEYPMAGGKKSYALVAGVSMEYVEELLDLGRKSSLMHSQIIRRNGTFVVRTGHEGCVIGIREDASQYEIDAANSDMKKLKEAMNDNVSYSALIEEHGETAYLLASRLPNTEWYLVSILPFGVLDGIIGSLNVQRQMIYMMACVVLLVGTLVLFVVYYHLSQQQIQEIDRVRKEAERANHAKSEFLSNMSHDIRTPMNGIVGMTAIAIANIEDTARVRDCLAKITAASRHLLGLINDVLDLSKIESGKMSMNLSQVSLRNTMESLVTIVQPSIKERRQHFDIFIQNIDVEDVCCDDVRLNQMLINILSNAVKFTQEEGTIRVYLAQEPSPKGSMYIRCHFRIKDNGIGMTEEFQKVIFDKFVRGDASQISKIEGSGLGMAITKYIVDAMDGTIEVQSQPGEGSEFHVILDFEKAQVRVEDMLLPPWRMLVVDNNEDLCRSAADSLKEIGVDAEWALDGQTAVEMVKRYYNSPMEYQIVLLDWKMPGMDGIETMREIRKILGDDVPILIISAYDWSDIEQEAREAGAQGFISKPLFKSNLFLGLKQYMMPEMEEEQEDAVPERAFAGKRILLAEDNDLNWEIAEDILTEIGFAVDRAENGADCVKMLKESKPFTYDCVLMDIRMPVMDGYHAAKAIRELERPDRSLPIIAMTADAFSDDIQRCLEYGMNAHVSKPVDAGKLVQVLHIYLEKNEG